MRVIVSLSSSLIALITLLSSLVALFMLLFLLLVTLFTLSSSLVRRYLLLSYLLLLLSFRFFSPRFVVSNVVVKCHIAIGTLVGGCLIPYTKASIIEYSAHTSYPLSTYNDFSSSNSAPPVNLWSSRSFPLFLRFYLICGTYLSCTPHLDVLKSEKT